MTGLFAWLRRRKTTASALVIAIVAGVPLTIAALHPGFPVAEVDLTSRDVWVTNGEQLLGGRLNRQIDELNGSVVASSPNFDVLQDGDSLFLHDPDSSRIESVDPASTKVTSAVEIPAGAEVAYGGTVLSILAPDGRLWGITAVGDLQFDPGSAPPLAELGAGAHAVVTRSGAILAVSPAQGKVYRVPTLSDAPITSDFPKVGEFQLAAIGDTFAVLDQSTNELLNESGSAYPLGADRGLRLQQSSPESPYAIVATGEGLVRVALGSGSVERIGAGIDAPTTDPLAAAAPVNLDGCAHGAWADAQRYLLACEGQDPVPQDVEQPTQGGRLEFRVNRSVIALNNLVNGNAWLMSENMRLVDNWEDVTPPEEDESDEEGDEQSAVQSFEDALAERTDENRPPTAVDDEFGVRPGRTTVLSVLDNDSDPDGDVLVVSDWDEIAEATGILDPIEGGRALQFTPAPGFSGIITFGYLVDDGRGGTASARVTASVVTAESNQPPVELRTSGLSVEANQTVRYNVLTNWRDLDGDDLYLVGASPRSGDLVRFTPDGFITFTHQTSELGEKEVVFQVSDGGGEPVLGTLKVDVEPPGSLNPVGTPDFETAFTGETMIIEPLLNDLSPSGAQLQLVAIEEPGAGAVASFSTDRGTISFSSAQPGVFYMKYTLQAGGSTSVGIVRLDVREPITETSPPPVAVKDTAYLRGDEPVTISVLANDISPTGRILAVQSVDVPAEVQAKGLVVELLESTLIRATATAALTEQVSFTYMISDGEHSATAGVTVVPVPALTKHQPPVAVDDPVTVRAGDIITVDVLANDYHPDDSVMFVDPELITEPAAGIGFVSRNTVRFQAPDQAGEYRADYQVRDAYGNTGAAAVVFTVTPVDEAGNRDPVPDPVVARVLTGGTIRIDVPMQGIDPDGDSTQLLRFPTPSSLGSVVEYGADYLVYEASPASSGTDSFTYQVVDAFGATGSADIKIAVIPEPSRLRPPNAVPDSAAVRPGRVAQVDLILNDSDPQGAPIHVEPELLDVPDGIDAEVVDERYLVLTAPDTEQSFSLRYTLSNDRGGSTISYVLVQVTADAPLLPPSADDIPIEVADIAGKESTTVDVFDGYAFNPAGRNEDLVLGVEGPNARSAQVLEQPGIVEVRPGPGRQAIAYRVTNDEDGLSALAFILVPAATDEGFDQEPFIDPDLPIQYVPMNESRQWSLSDILEVPSGREAWIFDEQSVTAVQSNGEPAYVDRGTIRFQGAPDYRGPAAVNFTVTDGASADDPKGNVVSLTLNIVVGDPDFRDTPPEFTTPSVQVEVGESTTIDLRASTAHPNPQILSEVGYSDVSSPGAGLGVQLSGSQLTLTTPRTTPKGTSFTLPVTLRWDRFTVPGTIDVTIVGSSRPLPVAVSDTYETQRGDGPVVANPLSNDSNPYQTSGEPLRIVDAQVQNSGEPAGISFTGETVRVTPDPSLKSGTITVVYTIEDATNDPDRRVNGTITVVVSDVPDQTAQPTRDGGSEIGGDQSATIRFDAPANNGKPITGYEVRSNPSVSTPPNCVAGGACTITGLANGQPYTFSVRAVNVHGPGEWSPYSDPIRPFGTPANVTPTLSVTSPWAPTGQVTASWPAVAGTGGSTTYFWRLSSGQTGSTTGTSAVVGGLSAGSYSIDVYAQNDGGKRSPGNPASNSVQIQDQLVPTQVTGIGGSVTDNTAPGAISWSWAPVGAGDPRMSDNLVYDWVLSSGQSGSTSGTSVTTSSLGVGNYTLTVTARNNAGPGPAGASASVGPINSPPPPPPSVSLSRGAFEPKTSNGYHYFVTLSNFGGGAVDIQCYDSDGHFWTQSGVPAGFSGELDCYSGYPPYYVVVNGVTSNVVSSW